MFEVIGDRSSGKYEANTIMINSYNRNDTVASLSTPKGNGAVSIVRVSGKNSVDIVNKFFKFKKEPTEIRSRKVYLGFWEDEKGLVDEVQVVFFLGKNTFTGENLVEIYTHGGYAVPEIVLSNIVESGARQSLPGELTYRAYLNGKIDLVKSQAINDIINSKTSYSARFLARNLKGVFSGYITRLRQRILNLSAAIEVQLDYPDEEFEEAEVEAISAEMESLISEIESVLAKSGTGMIIKKGIPVVLAGKPNVGKSTIMNLLLKEDRAIVTDIPGTTRDFIEEELDVKGIYIKLTDTAGLRGTDDDVEKIGITKALEKINRASLVIYIVDIEQGLDDYDRGILSEIGEKKIILVMNKADKTSQETMRLLREEISKIHSCNRIIVSSALTGEGVDELEESIFSILSNLVKVDDDTYITNDLQKKYINQVFLRLRESRCAIESGVTVDIIAQDLRECVELLDALTGRRFDEDLSDTIFASFCVGK